MTKTYQYKVGLLISLRNNPHSLRKPAINPKADIGRGLIQDDQVNFFKLLLDAAEDSSTFEDLNYEEVMAIISDYVESGNILYATNQIKTLRDTPKMDKFVDIALCTLLKNQYEDKVTVPFAVGELFAWLIAERILTYATLYPRFHKFLKQRDSIEAKYKHFMKAVTEFLVSLLISLSQYYKKYVLCGLLSAFQRSGEAQDLMALAMKRISELHSPDIAAKLWESAKFQWSEFLQPGMNEREFIKINKLDFLNSYTSDSKLEEHSVRPKTGYYVKPEHQYRQSTCSRVSHVPLTEKLVDESLMELKFENLIWAYFEDRDLEKFRSQIEPFIKHQKSVEFFVRYAIETGLNHGKEFHRPIGKLLSYLIAFGLMTEKQRLEALRSLIRKRVATFKDKDAMKKVISSFVVNSEVKSTALWASKKMKFSRIFDEAEDVCLGKERFDGGCPTLVSFLSSRKLGFIPKVSLCNDNNMFSQDLKLHTSDNPWKPRLRKRRRMKRGVDTDEDITDEELRKQFRGILNKLTPQKYAKLLEDVKKMTIDTDKKLQMILELICDQAENEPYFSNQYANLCKHLASLKVMNVEENKEVKFYPLLLARCQKVFESQMYEGINIEGEQKKINEAMDPEMKKLLLDKLDFEKRRVLRRRLGNMKFIGELYKLDMLKNNIILGCIEKLLSDDEEESLECLCTLLRTIGAKLELSPKYQEQVLKSGRDPLAPYFAKLLAIVNEKKTNARVRFMIQDILDMRANQWKARKIQNEFNPKTIDQIHADAQKEMEQRMVELQQHQHQQKRQQDGGGGGGQKKEWSRRSQQGTGNAQAVNSFTNLKNSYSDQTEFGPGQTFHTFDTGKARSGSQKATLQQHPEQFAGARKDSDAKLISLTSDKALGLLRDYLSDRDLKLAADDMKPYCSSPQNITTFVETALNHALEDTSQVRSAVGQLFSYFIINNVVSLEQFHNGLHSILSIAEDIVVDVPKFWEYMAEVLAPSFINLSDSNRRQFFVSALKPSIESGDAGKLMSHLVKYVASTNSPAKASMLWNCGKLRWSDFLKSDVNESDFVQKNNLDFLNHPSNESSTGLSDSENRDVKHLEDQKFFVEVTRKIKNGVNPLEIEDLIQQNYRSSTVNPAFASALVKAVVKACVIDPKGSLHRVLIHSPCILSSCNCLLRGYSTYMLDDKKLKSFCPILVKYCENDENCEVDALFALQGLAEELEHPPKLLNEIFTIIHDQNVISMDAFLLWERNDSLVPGKAMALMNVKQFLKWLKETEDSDS